MKLADWQKDGIRPAIEQGDADTVFAAIEKACTGGMHTTGPDYVSRDIRRIVMSYGIHDGPLVRELVQYVKDRMR